MANWVKNNTSAKTEPVLTETDLRTEKGLSAKEVDRRLFTLARVHRRVESTLAFYLKDVEERQLYLQYGFAHTVDYARERLGFEDRKTRSLLNIAHSFENCSHLKKAFQNGDIPWTKAREVAKVANPETDREWLEKTREMTNRQLEEAVRTTLPQKRKKTLVLVLDGDRVDAWEQSREACERMAGKTLCDIEVFDLMCAEVLCTYALTPPFGDEEERAGGFARSIAERDGWICTRPGCSNRSALTGNHIIRRSQGGVDEDWNKHLVCAACHLAITEGRLKVSGRAPDGLTWEGPFGVIEKPLPLSPEIRKGKGEPLVAREPKASYGTNRHRDQDYLEPFDARLADHVIAAADTVEITEGHLSSRMKIYLPNMELYASSRELKLFLRRL